MFSLPFRDCQRLAPAAVVRHRVAPERQCAAFRQPTFDNVPAQRQVSFRDRADSDSYVGRASARLERPTGCALRS
jgi:hypothetical protein